MSKTLYIIPGRKQSCADPAYKKIANHAKDAGYTVITCNIDRERKVMTDYVAEFLSKYWT